MPLDQHMQATQIKCLKGNGKYMKILCMIKLEVKTKQNST